MFVADLASFLLYADQARARLIVFKTRDVTPKQVVAVAERWRKEERQRLVTQQAKKVRCTTWFVHTPLLVALGLYRRSLFPAGTLPRTPWEEACRNLAGSEAAVDRGLVMAFAPSQVGEARAERSVLHRSGSRSSGDRTPAMQEHLAHSKTVGATS